jgi:hypothetical protein
MDAILPARSTMAAATATGGSWSTRTLRLLDDFRVVGCPRPHEEDDDENMNGGADRRRNAPVFSVLR